MGIILGVRDRAGQRPVFRLVVIYLMVIRSHVDLKIGALDEIACRVILRGERIRLKEFRHDLISVLGIGRGGIIRESGIIIPCFIDIHAQLDVRARRVSSACVGAGGELAGRIDDDIDIGLGLIITGGILQRRAVIRDREGSGVAAQSVAEARAVDAPVTVYIDIRQRGVVDVRGDAGIGTIHKPMSGRFIDNRSIGLLCAVRIQAADTGADTALHTCHGDHRFIALLLDMQIAGLAVDQIADVDAHDIVGTVKTGRLFMNRHFAVRIGDLLINHSVSEIAVRSGNIVFCHPVFHCPLNRAGLCFKSVCGAHDDRRRFGSGTVLEVLLRNAGNTDGLRSFTVHLITHDSLNLIYAGCSLKQIRIQMISILIIKYRFIDAVRSIGFVQIAMDKGGVQYGDLGVFIHIGSLFRGVRKNGRIYQIALNRCGIDDFHRTVQIGVAELIAFRSCCDHTAEHQNKREGNGKYRLQPFLCIFI